MKPLLNVGMSEGNKLSQRSPWQHTQWGACRGGGTDTEPTPPATVDQRCCRWNTVGASPSSFRLTRVQEDLNAWPKRAAIRASQIRVFFYYSGTSCLKPLIEAIADICGIWCYKRHELIMRHGVNQLTLSCDHHKYVPLGEGGGLHNWIKVLPQSSVDFCEGGLCTSQAAALRS